MNRDVNHQLWKVLLRIHASSQQPTHTNAALLVEYVHSIELLFTRCSSFKNAGALSVSVGENTVDQFIIQIFKRCLRHHGYVRITGNKHSLHLIHLRCRKANVLIINAFIATRLDTASYDVAGLLLGTQLSDLYKQHGRAIDLSSRHLVTRGLCDKARLAAVAHAGHKLIAYAIDIEVLSGGKRPVILIQAQE